MPDDVPINHRNSGLAPNPCSPPQISSNFTKLQDQINHIVNDGIDEKVKVNASGVTGYLEDKLADHHIEASAQYDSGPDLLIESDTVDGGGNKQVRFFFDVSGVADYNATPRQIFGHEATSAAPQYFKAGTLVTFADVGGDPAISHDVPAHDGTPDVTVGAASEGSESAASDDWDIGDGTLAAWVCSRIGYFHAGDEKLYAYFRKLSFDAKGHLTQVSGESRVEIEAPEAC